MLSVCLHVSSLVYGINSILYQRGVYNPETFTRAQKYGLTVLITTDEDLKKYLANVLTQVKGFIKKTIIVISIIMSCPFCTLKMTYVKFSINRYRFVGTVIHSVHYNFSKLTFFCDFRLVNEHDCSEVSGCY